MHEEASMKVRVRVLLPGLVLGLVATVGRAGTITGTVVYDGKVPSLKPMSVAAEPMCVKKHATVPNEALVLGSGNTMANVMVRVVKGLPAGKTWPAPKETVVMDQ